MADLMPELRGDVESKPRLYEGMFIVDINRVGTDDRSVKRVVHSLLEKHGAKVLVSTRWAEREFCYPIKKQTRGIYHLVYFECKPEKIAEIKRDCYLSGDILRVMMLRAKRVPDKVALPDGGWLELDKETTTI